MNTRLSFFEQPFILFGMIPMTVLFFSLMLFFPELVNTLSSFYFLTVFITWVGVYEVMKRLTNNFNFYLKWVAKRKLPKPITFVKKERILLINKLRKLRRI